MKILKPGKVEHRKFVCPKCGCTFVAENTDASVWGYVTCPQEKCLTLIHWQNSEPYGEPAPTQVEETVRTRLSNLLYIWDKNHYGGIPHCVDFLMEHGVTFKEV